MNRALWIAQGLLAVVFAFAGVSKLTSPPEMLATVSPFPWHSSSSSGSARCWGHWD